MRERIRRLAAVSHNLRTPITRLLALKRAFWNVIGNEVKYGDHITVV